MCKNASKGSTQRGCAPSINLGVNRLSLGIASLSSTSFSSSPLFLLGARDPTQGHVSHSSMNCNPKPLIMTQLTAMDQLYPPNSSGCPFWFFPSSRADPVPVPLPYSLFFFFSLGPLSHQPSTYLRSPYPTLPGTGGFLLFSGIALRRFLPCSPTLPTVRTRPSGRPALPPSLAPRLTGSLATVKRRSPSRLYLICVMDRSWPCSRMGFCGDTAGVSVPGTPPHPDWGPPDRSTTCLELTIPAVTRR